MRNNLMQLRQRRTRTVSSHSCTKRCTTTIALYGMAVKPGVVQPAIMTTTENMAIAVV